jgi:hypothetical protein
MRRRKRLSSRLASGSLARCWLTRPVTTTDRRVSASSDACSQLARGHGVPQRVVEVVHHGDARRDCLRTRRVPSNRAPEQQLGENGIGDAPVGTSPPPRRDRPHPGWRRRDGLKDVVQVLLLPAPKQLVVEREQGREVLAQRRRLDAQAPSNFGQGQPHPPSCSRSGRSRSGSRPGAGKPRMAVPARPRSPQRSDPSRHRGGIGAGVVTSPPRWPRQSGTFGEKCG